MWRTFTLGDMKMEKIKEDEWFYLEPKRKAFSVMGKLHYNIATQKYEVIEKSL